ncbi:DUF4367 domain-containing protein [Christensenellaceae bacterium OttesenSCG-928-M15]|nr:DUF4367 domain-containing protein [Christensenellaceae bacterium OttesenSCG-928-M15]
MDINTKKELLEKFSMLSENDQASVDTLVAILEDITAFSAKQLGIEQETFVEILDGKKKAEVKIVKLNTRSRKTLSYLKRFSVAVLLLVAVFSVSLMGFAQEVQQAVINVFSGPSAIQVDTFMEQADIAKLHGYVVPAYVPEGYTVQNIQTSQESGVVHVLYQNIENVKIAYYYFSGEAVIQLDDEYTNYEEIEINGTPAILTTQTGGWRLLLTTYQTQGSVRIEYSDGLSDEEIIKMAGSITKQERK